MMAFYVVHGLELKDLLNMPYIEKQFMHYARDEHYKEEKLKWRHILLGVIREVMGGGE